MQRVMRLARLSRTNDSTIAFVDVVTNGILLG